MKKLSILILIIVSALAGQTPSRRLVMISVDGLMPRTLRNAEKLGLKLPNLTEFRDRGATSTGLTGVFPTVTYPSHTTMVTGRAPAEHGIISNTLFDPERKMNGAWYWYAELIKVPTLWDAARKQGLTTAAVGWPVTVGARIDHNFPEYGAPRTLNDVLLLRALATAGLVPEFEKAHGPISMAGEHFDDLLSSIAAFMIERYKPHLLLVHLVDLDHDQHGHGPESPEALRTLEQIDGAIGKIRKAVQAAGAGAETSWIVVSDHGFFPVEKAFHPEALLNSLGLSARVAAHRNGGSAAFVVRDPKDLEAQDAVMKSLKKLKDEGQYGIDRILERGELAQLKAYPHAFAAVSMSSGWTAGSGRSGPLVTPSGDTRGTHGYLPGPEALESTFVAFGPGIRPRQLPKGNLTDVAATAANLLGLAFPGSGRNLLD
jgi:predicted AlkP superfamily pyrophosphatase or phosphodiesterase